MQLYPDLKQVKLFNAYRYYYHDSLTKEDLDAATKMKQNYIKTTVSLLIAGDLLKEISVAFEGIMKYFRICPLCLSNSSMVFEMNWRGKFISCSKCSARWYIGFDDKSLKWAKLLETSTDGRGRNLLGEEHAPEFWMKVVSEEQGKGQNSQVQSQK